MVDIDFKLSDSINIDIGTPETTFNIEDNVSISAETDHRKLTHRDAEGQHPIEAIDNLREELEELETDPLSSIEIDEIFKMAVI